MSRHKTAPLSARPWDLYAGVDQTEVQLFEKIRPSAARENSSETRLTKGPSRQQFHRPRFG